jgi:hypothetical protein
MLAVVQVLVAFTALTESVFATNDLSDDLYNAIVTDFDALCEAPKTVMLVTVPAEPAKTEPCLFPFPA